MCPAPTDVYTLNLVHSNGLHKLRVQYCQCCVDIARFKQLLRARLFPASERRIKTVFSFDFLEAYHKLTLQSKTSLYDFYAYVLQRTDGTIGAKNLVSATLSCVCAITYAHE
jgi:hypothetical protein